MSHGHTQPMPPLKVRNTLLEYFSTPWAIDYHSRVSLFNPIVQHLARTMIKNSKSLWSIDIFHSKNTFMNILKSICFLKPIILYSFPAWRSTKMNKALMFHYFQTSWFYYTSIWKKGITILLVFHFVLRIFYRHLVIWL